MGRTFWRCALLMGALLLGPMAQAQQEMSWHSPDIAMTYTLERAKVALTDCGCFWLQGGSVNGSVPLYHGLSIAANFTGEHSSGGGTGVDLNKIAFMAGPRYTLNMKHWSDSKHHPSVFGEALFGVAHGFDSIFPITSGIETSANSFSLQVGGGLNIGLTTHFGVRALEIDYVRTTLPNSADNTQNDLRLAFGITYRFGKPKAK